MAKTKNSNMAADSQLVGCSIEKDLVAKIDILRRRDGLTRSTWIREALIQAWKNGQRFQRTEKHGYLATPIALEGSHAAAPSPRKRKKA